MSTQTGVGYEAFTKWEKKMARGKAEKLVHADLVSPPNRRAGLSKSDIPDVEQEMLLQIHLKRGRFNPDHESGAAFQNFIGYALDKFASNFIRDKNRQKRGGGEAFVSLSKEVGDEESEEFTIGDMIADERLPGQQCGTPDALYPLGARQPASHLRFDVDRLLERLNNRQKKIGRHIMEGHDVKEIGSRLGISRAELYREIARMRKILYAKGLKDYLC